VSGSFGSSFKATALAASAFASTSTTFVLPRAAFVFFAAFELFFFAGHIVVPLKAGGRE
jgi:hypothetical protein